MKHFKDIDVCIAELEALYAGNDIEPEQKKYVETAIRDAKKLRRTHGSNPAEVYRSVRRIARSLLNAFLKH
jgi:DNA repair ATPase RecN